MKNKLEFLSIVAGIVTRTNFAGDEMRETIKYIFNAFVYYRKLIFKI